MPKAATKIEMRPVGSVKPYGKNAKKHPPEQVEKLARIIERHGFDQPIVVDASGVVIKGHGRLLAAKALKLAKVPVVVRADLTPAQVREARIADNRVAELGEWDFDILATDVVGGLKNGLDLDIVGFSLKELGLVLNEDGAIERTAEEALNENYTRKIKAPVYEPKEKSSPPVEKLFDSTKTQKLEAEIEGSGAPEGVKSFLRIAAARHIVFDYAQIAEFYAHASAEVQDLMEKSALVIVDFKKAIENGFVVMSEEIAELHASEHPE